MNKLIFCMLMIAACAQTSRANDVRGSENPTSNRRGWCLSSNLPGVHRLEIDVNNQSCASITPAHPIEITFADPVGSLARPNIFSLSALNLTIPNGASLGHVSGATEYVYVYATNYNGGVIELAVSGDGGWDINTLHSTTALSGSSTNRFTLYSPTARASVAIAYLGRMQVNEATAGVWDSYPIQVDTLIGSPQRLVGVTERNKVASASIAYSAGTYSVSSQSGTWISSVTRNAAGDFTANILSGTFASAPTCTAAPDSSSAISLSVTGTTTTAVNGLSKASGTGTATDSGLSLICMGSY